ncbi:hypothetical protein JTB14_010839 [Gonioctena quinquepunctata]|nr:hypothetical protein JTB14_010839 [Gonioctena quinquepunctata]
MLAQGFVILAVFSERQLCFAEQKSSYMFSYAINTREIISHRREESTHGIVRGSFSFLQPDGLIRIVQYRSDERSGFRAVVRYRKPSANLMGHLRYPKDFSRPVVFAVPVSRITSDLFE